MAGRVDQVERVLPSVQRGVEQADRVRLDRDAALLLQIHGIEDLAHRLLGVHGPGDGEKTIGERRLAVVDVGDDGEVTDQRGAHPVQNTMARRRPVRGAVTARSSPVEARVVRHTAVGFDHDAGPDVRPGADARAGADHAVADHCAIAHRYTVPEHRAGHAGVRADDAPLPEHRVRADLTAGVEPAAGADDAGPDDPGRWARR